MFVLYIETWFRQAKNSVISRCISLEFLVNLIVCDDDDESSVIKQLFSIQFVLPYDMNFNDIIFFYKLQFAIDKGQVDLSLTIVN